MNDNVGHGRRPATALREAHDAEAGPDAGAVSLWSATAPAFAGGDVARGELTTDIAVVGAGVAGLSTALHLREAGIETMVFEAEQPGSGATGVSGGILAPEFARNGIEHAIRLYGRQKGERLARMVGNSAAFTFDLISKYGIECDQQQGGFVSPGQTSHEIEALQADASAWQSLGFPVEFLSAVDTADAIGSDNYAGALRFEQGGALNPLAYATGLAHQVQRDGVQIFTRSPVLKIEKGDGFWELRLPNARVRANRVVLAANGGNNKLHPSLRNVTLPLLVYEYATLPFSEADREKHFGAGLPYTDRKAYVFTARLDRDGRLISAIPEVIPGWNRSRFVQEASRRIRDIYRTTPSMELEYTWPGTAYLNSSLMPAVYSPGNDLTLIAIQACNGRGIGVNTVLGSEVARLMAEGRPDSLAAPLQRPKSVPIHFLASRVPKVIMSLAQRRDRSQRKRTG